ncbi:MAG: hypothetical protein HYT80_09365 [Euryarchaeota archaeon]|nr:hypothetical protein [Euryarchaeota archaeon]
MPPVKVAALVLACLVLSSGCVIPAEGGRFPRHDQSRSAEYPNFDNLVVSGTLAGGGDEVRIDALAHNQGPHTYKVSAICSPTWFEDMVGRFGEVNHRQPMAYCEAFG